MVHIPLVALAISFPATVLFVDRLVTGRAMGCTHARAALVGAGAALVARMVETSCPSTDVRKRRC